MRRSKSVEIAVVSSLVLFSLVAGARASEFFDAAADWGATYASTAAVAASGSATWGNSDGPNAWSAGEFSYNWTNQNAVNVPGTSLQVMTTYYLPSTGDETSANTVLTTYNYTVPWQQYQFNPGQTIQQQVGPTLVNQINAGLRPEGPTLEQKMQLPANTSISSATTTSGTLQEVGAATGPATDRSVEGFTTTSYNPTVGKFSDGGGFVQDAPSGVFYNYGAATTSNGGINGFSPLNFPSSSATDTLQISEAFGGPAYVAWTAPQAGYITISMTAADQTNGQDGNPGFYIVDSLLGPSAPIFSAPFQVDNGAGQQYTQGTMQSNPTTTLGGTITNYNPNYGPGGSGDPTIGLSWTSATNAMYVQAGETLYFAGDPGHDQFLGHDSHAFGNAWDSIALSAQIALSAVPEPASSVLFAMAGIGLVLTACRRR